jgi:ABC-type antimicrobial peptide transport system permease subunit
MAIQQASLRPSDTRSAPSTRTFHSWTSARSTICSKTSRDNGASRQRRSRSFGLLGLLLSAVGLCGVVAYGVRERARELGIRLALGARPADVRRLVLRQGFTIIGVGLAFGAAATAALTQVMRSSLFGVDPLDPPTLATVCAVLTAVGFAALYLPARWASRIEPAQTLRAE